MIYHDDMIQRADGDDYLHGGSWLNRELPDLADTIYGGGGDDIITGGKGGDTILGGPGHDRIDGWHGEDFLYGDYRPEDYDDYSPPGPYSHDGDGNDEIYGDPGDDWLSAGDTDDTIISPGAGADGPLILDKGQHGDHWHYDAYGFHFLKIQSWQPHEEWVFEDVALHGRYQVFATWVTATGTAQYEIYDGGNPVPIYTEDVSQAYLPDIEMFGHNWYQLGGTYTLNNAYEQVRVQLSCFAHGWVCADAVMLYPVWPEVNLVTDCVTYHDDDWDEEPEHDIWNEREENGFYGGSIMYYTLDPRREVAIRFELNGYDDDLDGKLLRLDWTGEDGSLISVWDEVTGGSQVRDSELATWKTWTIGVDPIPGSVFVQVDTPGQMELTLTLLDEITLEPLLGRPLRDTIMFTLREPLV